VSFSCIPKILVWISLLAGVFNASGDISIRVNLQWVSLGSADFSLNLIQVTR
jgi:hypothetical protein